MEIIQAKEPDIVEALYIIKTAFDTKNLSENYWRPPVPDYEKLKDELNSGFLYMVRNNHISIATLSFTDEIPASYKKINWDGAENTSLIIRRIAVAPNWMNDEIKNELEKFITNYAKEHNCNSIKLNVYSTNEDMNEFYQNLGFNLKNKNKTEEFETPFNYYEKILK